MMPTELPHGRYLSLAFEVMVESGGQTRALLMRNRILATEGGVRPDILTLGAGPDYARRREILRERGRLPEGVGLLNIYDHYRERGWGDLPPTGELEDLSAHVEREETRPDGEPWRRIHRLPGERRPVIDYLRADGIPFLRMPAFRPSLRRWWRGPILAIAAGGAVVGRFETAGRWFRHWIRELAGDERRVFVFMDSRFVVPHVVPMRGRRFHLIYLMHNLHVLPPRRWNSEVDYVYARVLRRIGSLDAMVTLTERQRDDIAERNGRTSNLFVVPTPRHLPDPPAQPPRRDPNQVTIVARLEEQKGLADAIAAFALVVAAVPGARLDIYGDGSEAASLAAEIERRGLGASIALRGFDPGARDTLWTASAFLMTSRHEGYPLATLESMGRGCPVVSYDVKYGPREQMTDGVDGFLVPPGDTALLAQRVIELLRSPALVERMGAAARLRAAEFGPSEFLERWASVVRATVAHKRRRTRIDEVRLELTRLRTIRRNPLLRLAERAPDFRLGPAGGDRALELAAVLELKGASRRARPAAARLELAWVQDESGLVTPLPLEVEKRDGRFHLHARAALPAADARLRLRTVWRNSARDVDVVRLERGVLSRPGAA